MSPSLSHTGDGPSAAGSVGVEGHGGAARRTRFMVSVVVSIDPVQTRLLD